MKFLLLATLLLFISCNGTEENVIKDRPKATGEYFEYINQGDTAYTDKHLADKNEAAIKAYESAFTLKKTDPELYVKLMRCYYNSAMYFGEKKEKSERLRLLSIAKQFGTEGLKLNPRMKKAMEEKKGWDEITSFAKRADVPIMYWLGVCWGRWGELKGITTVAVDIGKVEALIQKVLDLDDTYFAGGADRFFGVFYMQIPKINGRDPEKAREHFEKAIQIAPDFLQNYLIFAEYYCVQEEDEDLFVELCEKIVEKEKDSQFTARDWKIDNDISVEKAKVWLTEDYLDDTF